MSSEDKRELQQLAGQMRALFHQAIQAASGEVDDIIHKEVDPVELNCLSLPFFVPPFFPLPKIFWQIK